MSDPHTGYRAVRTAEQPEGWIVIRRIRDLGDWLALRDYDRDRTTATKRVVARISRGNTIMQNGWYMDEAGLKRKSLLGDRSIEKLKRFVNAAQRKAPRHSSGNSNRVG